MAFSLGSYSEELDMGLLKSVGEGSLDKVKYYVDKGADVHALTDDGRNNPLRLAAIKSYMDILKYLVEECHVKPKKDSRVLQMAMMSNKKKEVVRYLVEHGADINKEDEALGTPLMIALREDGDEEFATWFIEEFNPDIKIVTKKGERTTAVHKACQNSSLDMIKYLIDKAGKDVLDVFDGRGYTPFTESADKGRADVVAMLLERYNVDPNIETDLSPLFMAVQNRNVEIVKILLEHNADPNFVAPERKCVPLHLAASNDFQSIIKLLLDHGAEPDVEDPRGFTPLLMASSEGYKGTIKLLVESGANVNHISHSENTTPLFHAVLANRIGAARTLLELGANPYLPKMPDESTMADMARSKGNTRIANLLDGWVQAEGKDIDKKLCNKCYTYKEKLKQCSRCKSRWYCSVSCQKEDWRVHKLNCKPSGA